MASTTSGLDDPVLIGAANDIVRGWTALSSYVQHCISNLDVDSSYDLCNPNGRGALQYHLEKALRTQKNESNKAIKSRYVFNPLRKCCKHFVETLFSTHELATKDFFLSHQPDIHHYKPIRILYVNMFENKFGTSEELLRVADEEEESVDTDSNINKRTRSGDKKASKVAVEEAVVEAPSVEEESVAPAAVEEAVVEAPSVEEESVAPVVVEEAVVEAPSVEEESVAPVVVEEAVVETPSVVEVLIRVFRLNSVFGFFTLSFKFRAPILSISCPFKPLVLS